MNYRNTVKFSSFCKIFVNNNNMEAKQIHKVTSEIGVSFSLCNLCMINKSYD